MKATAKIKHGAKVIEKKFMRYITQIQVDIEDPRIKLSMKDGVTVYIQYNNHNQYSYSILFSKGALDRSRFDNYDDHWDVKSKPHHYHPRLSRQGVSSPLNGEIQHDFEILFSLLISGKLYDSNFNFNE